MNKSMIFPDYHLHSTFSTDCETNIHDNIKSAIKNGLSSICITDHYDMDFPTRPEEPWMNFYLDIDKYFAYMSEVKNKYAPDFDLRIGIELGVMQSTCAKLNELVKNHPELDFIISSTHLVDGNDPYYPEYFEGKSEVEAYRAYFEEIYYNVQHFKNYNVYGHLDYVLRYGPNQADNFNINDYKDLFVEIFKIITYEGKGIEINTASLYKGLDFPHPHKDILKLYKEAGGEIITIGSDSHRSENIGYGFDVAKKSLLSQGFKYYTTFSKQKPTFNIIE